MPNTSSHDHPKGLNSSPPVGSFTGSFPSLVWVPPVLDDEAPIDRVLAEKSVTSVNSPGYKTTLRTVRVAVKPRKFTRRPPVVPRFHPPFFPPKYGFRDAQKIAHTSKEAKRLSKARSNYDKKYQKRLAIAMRKRQDYIARYNLRLVRYGKALERYNASYARFKAHPPFISKVRKIKRALPNNPYVQIKKNDAGWYADFSYRKGFTLSRNGLGEITGGFQARHGTEDYQIGKAKGYLGQGPSIFIGDFDFINHGAVNSGKTSIQEMLDIADYQATSKVYAKLNDQKVHLAQVVAERAQTVSLISDITRRVASLVTSPRKLLKKIAGMSGRAEGSTLSNDYLALKFGVEPLLSDIWGAAEALAKITHQQSDTVVIRSVTEQSATRDTFDVLDDAPRGTWYRTKKYVKTTVKVSYVIEYSINNVYASTLQSLGLINPAEVGWELVPWSFVVDWFIPIGNFINSITSDVGLSFKSGTKTVSIKTTQHTRREYDPSYGEGFNIGVYKGWVQGDCVQEQKVRTVLTGPITPYLPRFKNPLSTGHFLLSLALLGQRVFNSSKRTH